MAAIDDILSQLVANQQNMLTRITRLERDDKLRRLDLQGPTITAATTLVLGEGNLFVVNGTTPVEFIDPTGWTPGSIVRLQFFTACSIVNNSMGGSDPLVLMHQAGYTTSPGDILGFIYINNAWYEIERIPLNQAGPWSRVISAMMALPGLVGLWPGGVVGTSGQLNDLSQNGLFAVPTNNPLLSTLTQILWAWQDSQAAGVRYHTVADTAVIDVTGTESWISNGNQGLTIGFVIYPTLAGTPTLMSKWSDAGSAQRAYKIGVGGGGAFEFHVSGDGVTDTFVSHSATYSANNFYHVYGRWQKLNVGTRMSIFVNGVKETTITGVVPATIFNSTRDLILGAEETTPATFTNEMHGLTGMWFLCAAYVPDEILAALFDVQRGVTGL